MVVAHVQIDRVYQRFLKRDLSVDTSTKPKDLPAASAIAKIPKKTFLQVNPVLVQKEKLLIHKSIAISGIFAFSWMFFVAKVIYEGSAKAQVHPVYEHIVEFMGDFGSPLLIIIILYIYDAKFKQNIRETLRLDYFLAIYRRRKATAAAFTARKNQHVVRNPKSTNQDSNVIGPLQTIEMDNREFVLNSPTSPKSPKTFDPATATVLMQRDRDSS